MVIWTFLHGDTQKHNSFIISKINDISFTVLAGWLTVHKLIMQIQYLFQRKFSLLIYVYFSHAECLFLSWIMTQGYTRVPTMAAFSGKSRRSRGHREKGCQDQQSWDTSVHLWGSRPTCMSALSEINPDDTHNLQYKMQNNSNACVKFHWNHHVLLHQNSIHIRVTGIKAKTIPTKLWFCML